MENELQQLHSAVQGHTTTTTTTTTTIDGIYQVCVKRDVTHKSITTTHQLTSPTINIFVVTEINTMSGFEIFLRECFPRPRHSFQPVNCNIVD